MSDEIPMNDQQKVAQEDSDCEKCSICLSYPLTDASSLDGCVHRFCYFCILEWVKMRPVCPLCKSRVSVITREVGNGNMIGQITICEVQLLVLRERIEKESKRPMTEERAQLCRRIRRLQRLVRMDDQMAASVRRTRVRHSINRDEYVQLINRYQSLLDNFERPRHVIIGDPTFRLLIYEAKLRRMPIVREIHVTGRRVSISPLHFRENIEVERPRITEFVCRDLSALLPAGINVETFAVYIYDLATEHQIMSPHFARILSTTCRVFSRYVDQFAELLYDFAVSGQSLTLYDQNSEFVSLTVYNDRMFNTNVVSVDDDNDIQIDGVVQHISGRASSRRGPLNYSESYAQMQFRSIYADALVGLSRLLLYLRSYEPGLSGSDERSLENVVVGICRAYLDYRYPQILQIEDITEPTFNDITLDEILQSNDENGGGEASVSAVTGSGARPLDSGVATAEDRLRRYLELLSRLSNRGQADETRPGHRERHNGRGESSSFPISRSSRYEPYRDNGPRHYRTRNMVQAGRASNQVRPPTSVDLAHSSTDDEVVLLDPEETNSAESMNNGGYSMIFADDIPADMNIINNVGVNITNHEN